MEAWRAEGDCRRSGDGEVCIWRFGGREVVVGGLQEGKQGWLEAWRKVGDWWRF